jgi:TonB-dependent receptor
MAQRRLRLLALWVLLLLWAGASRTEATLTGTVLGQVLDPLGDPLAHARVEVVGSRLAVATDGAGFYRLSGVSVGTRQLAVSYLGYQSVSVAVEVKPGEATETKVTLPFGDVVTIRSSPLLSGQARALNQQKQTLRVTHVVAADQIGRFPDSNAAEAAQRIPGVTLQRDQGEGRYLLVRGTEARLNSMTVNGERLPSPEGDGRDVPLDVIPADLLEAIEVTKTLTPDMDGDAIGGTVNLVTRRAPLQRRIAVAVAAGANEITRGGVGAARLAYGQRFGSEQKSGLILAGSRLETDRGADDIEPEYNDGALDDLELRDYTVERRRSGWSGSFDHRLSERSEIFLRALWNEFDDDEIRRRKRERVGRDRLERQLRDRLLKQTIVATTVDGSHVVGRSLLVEYRLAWSFAEGTTDGRLDSTFLQRDVEFDPNVSPDDIDPQDIRANPRNEDLAAFTLDELTFENNSSREEDRVAALDFTMPWNVGLDRSGSVKAGAKVRLKEKRRDRDVWEIDVEATLAGLTDDFVSETPFFGGRYDLGQFQDPAAMRRLARGAVRQKDVENDLEDYRATEDTLAVYAMVELALGRHTLLGGGRYEETDASSRAFTLYDGDDFLTPVTEGNRYGELLPMFLWRLRLAESSSLRLALSRTLARPSFEDLAPTFFEEDDERQLGNPDLDVTTSWNFDLLWDRFLEPIGLISAGVFYKEIADHIFPLRFEQIDDGVVFEVTQPHNAARAEILGFELSFQNRLTHLPRPFDGLGVYFNYTYVDSEADFPGRSGSRLQGQAEHVGNLSLSYEQGGFSARLSGNYHGEYLSRIGNTGGEDLFVDKHFQVDFKASQRLAERLRLVVELINLGDEPFRIYEGTVDRPVQEELYGRWGSVGLEWHF